MNDDSSPHISADEPDGTIEALWPGPGEVPDLRAVLADNPHWSPRELRAVLLVDQQFRCRTSRAWRTEDYLALVPSLAPDDDLALDLIYGECRGRSRHGDPPDLKELVHRFPQLQQRLERQREIGSWFEDAVGGEPSDLSNKDSCYTFLTSARFASLTAHRRGPPPLAIAAKGGPRSCRRRRSFLCVSKRSYTGSHRQ